jgi:hypothetical protein
MHRSHAQMFALQTMMITGLYLFVLRYAAKTRDPQAASTQ